MTNEITPPQITAIKAALKLYDDKIARLEESIHSNHIWIGKTTQHGKLKAEAVRAAARQAHGRIVVDQLIAERNALAAAFGVTL